MLGTWMLRSYVRERLSDGQRHNQFGEAPVGYIGYAPDGRMYAIFTRDDRVAPRDVVPTDEEGVQLLGTMVAYAGTFSLGDTLVVHHIDTSWNQAWTGTDQIAVAMSVSATESLSCSCQVILAAMSRSSLF
jgi:hypothetical protein